MATTIQVAQATETEQQAIDAFIADVKAIIAARGETDATLEEMAARMRTLIAHPAVRASTHTAVGNAHTPDAARHKRVPLYTDETGLTLVRARFGPEALTPIHDHGTWGIVGVYCGRDRYQRWQRLDAGTDEGEARLTMIDERVLEPGDVAIIPPVPQDIHAQGGEGEATDEFVLFGKNAMNIRRLYFDPTTNTAHRQPARD